MFFFFKQKTAYEMRISDWSSDVCSSDLRQFVRDRRSNPLWIIGEETATDLHQLTIGLREKAVAQHHLEARAASRDGSDAAVVIDPVPAQAQRQLAGRGQGHDRAGCIDLRGGAGLGLPVGGLEAPGPDAQPRFVAPHPGPDRKSSV